MITKTCKILAVACSFCAFAYTTASANVSVEETANGATTVAATNNQQTNIVSTIVSGGTTTVRITSVSTTGPATPTTFSISVPSGGLNPNGVQAGGTVTITTSGGGTVTGTVNADGSITVPIEGGGSVTVDADTGATIEVNYLDGFDATLRLGDVVLGAVPRSQYFWSNFCARCTSWGREDFGFLQ